MKIETDNLILRPITYFDARDMFEYASDPRLALYGSWTPHTRIEETLRVIENMIEKSDDRPLFAIVHKADKKMIGTIHAKIDKTEDGAGKRCEVGYIISPAYQNRGYASQSLTAFIKYLFDECNIHRVEGRHLAKNIASGRVMDKAGMEVEGVLRDFYFKDGSYHDVVIHAIINDK